MIEEGSRVELADPQDVQHNWNFVDEDKMVT